MESWIAPRVNKLHIQKFQNKNVRVFGKVLKKDPNEVVLLTPDEGEIKCVLDGSHDVDSLETYVEVLGKVVNSDTVTDVLYVQSGGNNINLPEVNKLINLSFHEDVAHLF